MTDLSSSYNNLLNVAITDTQCRKLTPQQRDFISDIDIKICEGIKMTDDEVQKIISLNKHVIASNLG